MPALLDVVGRLLPKERSRWRNGWPEFPWWPPDMFAVTASIVDISGCYASPRYTAHRSRGCLFDGPYLARVTGLGQAWREWSLRQKDRRQLEGLWRRVSASRKAEISEPRRSVVPPWCDAVMELMAIADEAGCGMGFHASHAADLPLAGALAAEYGQWSGGKGSILRLPASICMRVPSTEACVIPKTRTPQLGCTLRSLSHNLALLPPPSVCDTTWVLPPQSVEATEREPFNLLLVPFPYRVRASCFVADRAPRAGEPSFFTLQQKWLRNGGRRLSSAQIAGFLHRLILEAERDVRKVHGVVLPELALDKQSLEKGLAPDVANRLGRLGVELFIAGTYTVPATRGTFGRNSAYCVSNGPGGAVILDPPKHHRWRLERDQIVRYSLGDALQPSAGWWEEIDIEKRSCCFFVLRHGATLTTLVCEDLARIEPVQPIIRAVGPNLVVALLMDGSQRTDRWSARYATVLADDPGSSVLTVTSLGMVRRSESGRAESSASIGLWKEPGGQTEQLMLPAGAHALLLTLSISAASEKTLDRRQDGSSSVKITLGGLHAVKDPQPRAWLDG